MWSQECLFSWLILGSFSMPQCGLLTFEELSSHFWAYQMYKMKGFLQEISYLNNILGMLESTFNFCPNYELQTYI